METLYKKYAFIYIDREGLTLAPHVENYATESIIADYYKNNKGLLQWNTYIIIPKELVPDDKIEEIESNQTYTRKYVIESDKIDDFIDDYFPELNEENMFEMKIIKGTSWIDAKRQAAKERCDFMYHSIFREYDELDSIKMMDKIRAALITHSKSTPNKVKAVFYTHLTHENSLFEKKFKLFLVC